MKALMLLGDGVQNTGRKSGVGVEGGAGRCEVRLAGHARVQVCELRGGHGAQRATDESRAGECRGRLLKGPSAEGCLQPITP